jgi:IPT/TIG domain-containing protein
VTFVSHYRMALDYYDASYPPDLFAPAPLTLSAVAPTSGPDEGGTPVTLTGSGFRKVTSVNFGQENFNVPFAIVSDTTITTTSPPIGSDGTPVDIWMADSESQATGLPGVWSYTGASA